MLSLNENNAYTEMDTVGIPSGRQVVDGMDTQVSIGKDSVVKDSKEKEKNIKKKNPTDMIIGFED